MTELWRYNIPFFNGDPFHTPTYLQIPPSESVGAMEITTKPIVEEPCEEANPTSGTVEEVEDRNEIDAEDVEEVGVAKEQPAAAGGEHAEESIHEQPAKDVEMEEVGCPFVQEGVIYKVSRLTSVQD